MKKVLLIINYLIYDILLKFMIFNLYLPFALIRKPSYYLPLKLHWYHIFQRYLLFLYNKRIVLDSFQYPSLKVYLYFLLSMMGTFIFKNNCLK